jgi:ElaB/YqjD/DUF883 family membrane-anchored ribosome-binding protein
MAIAVRPGGRARLPKMNSQGSSAMATAKTMKKEVTNNVAEFGSTVATDLHDMRDAATRMMADTADAFRGAAEDYLADGRERAHDMMGRVQGKVQDEPMKALLIAAGVGMLLGAMFFRR